VVVDLSTHFAGRPPEIRELFDAWLAFVERAGGPTTVLPQKTRIALQRRVRFGSVHVRQRWLDCGLWLRRRADHPRLHRIDDFGPAAQYHWFRLRDPAELDGALAALVAEAYHGSGADTHRAPQT
jgi:hypothetical protein